MSARPSTAERPFIHVNVAVSEDGRMGSANGGSLSISTRQDWRRVHRLREHYQAVAVGARTWCNELPRLTARTDRLGREPQRQPDRVIFGGRGSCAVPADQRRTFVIGSREPDGGRAIFIRCDEHALRQPLAALHHHRIRSLLVEGGPTLIKSFLAEGCFDCLTAFVRTRDPEAAATAVRRVLPGAPPMAPDAFGGGILLRWGKEL